MFSSNSHIAELGPYDNPIVGITHNKCLKPADRVVGTIQNSLFDTHPELVDFDVSGWFKALHSGQMVFSNAEYLAGSRQARILWSGNEKNGPLNNFIVEISLLNGDREIVTQRNCVHRFSKDNADAFANRLNTTFQQGRAEKDPYCYSDESKTFGPRSEILGLLDSKEKLRPINQARPRKYDAAFAARFTRPGHWYAPILYLTDSATDQPVSFNHAVFLLTEPLELRIYLENWREAKINITDYQTEALLSDSQFDDWMRWNEARGFWAVVNPILNPATGDIISGYHIASLERFSDLQDVDSVI